MRLRNPLLYERVADGFQTALKKVFTCGLVLLRIDESLQKRHWNRGMKSVSEQRRPLLYGRYNHGVVMLQRVEDCEVGQV